MLIDNGKSDFASWNQIFWEYFSDFLVFFYYDDNSDEIIRPCWQLAPCLRWTGAARSLLTLYIPSSPLFHFFIIHSNLQFAIAMSLSCYLLTLYICCSRSSYLHSLSNFWLVYTFLQLLSPFFERSCNFHPF